MRVALLSAAVAISLILPAAAQQPDPSRTREFAQAIVIADLAASTCSGLRPNLDRLDELMRLAGVRPNDQALMRKQFEALVPMIRGDLARLGRSIWCMNVRLAYGPSGDGILQISEQSRQRRRATVR